VVISVSVKANQLEMGIYARSSQVYGRVMLFPEALCHNLRSHGAELSARQGATHARPYPSLIKTLHVSQKNNHVRLIIEKSFATTTICFCL
jgi:hypothetical protein